MSNEKFEKVELKDALNFLEKRGIGSGTNITVHETACLMVGFANEHLSPLSQQNEAQGKEGLCYGPDCEGCRNSDHDICFKRHLKSVDQEQPDHIAEVGKMVEQPERKRTAEDILENNLSENLWKFINDYPVGIGADKMLKDWIIEAMQEYASEGVPSDTVGEIVFNEFNQWVYNDTNEAGDKLQVIDAHDLPEIISGIVAKLNQTNKLRI